MNPQDVAAQIKQALDLDEGTRLITISEFVSASGIEASLGLLDPSTNEMFVVNVRRFIDKGLGDL